ncbi:MAG: S8 family serine peptidase, partial [Lachnospiraceae bacterium]|nr:S8 family serine peptidase [Lachnospiraceae bacterium]
MNKRKRGIGILLILCILLTILPGTVSFAAPEVDENDFDVDLLIEDILNENPFFYLEPCEQVVSEVTLHENFEDNSVMVVLTRAASRDDRTFTADDFRDVGAVYVEDIDRLSNRESVYAEELWDAEQRMYALEYIVNTYDIPPQMYEILSFEIGEAVQQYEIAQQVGEESTLVNFDEYRRILRIRLDRNSRENVLHVIQQLQQHEYIYAAEPSYIYEPNAIIPNDPEFNLQWAATRLNLPQAWTITTGSRAVRVGIIGHGIDAHHPELVGRVSALACGSIREINTGSNQGFGYGTRQAGIIGAMGNNGIGIAGIAWNVELVSIAAGRSHPAGVTAAREAGIPILTRSFSGGTAADVALNTAVRNYTGLFVNSAGNYSQNTSSNPRLPGLSNAIIVGASDTNDLRQSYSNFGAASVHLFAPSQVLTTGVNNSFTGYGGTSAAAPHVAGVAALVLSVNPNLTPEQVRGAILDSVDPIPAMAQDSISGGRLNAYGAVRRAGNMQPAHRVILHAGVGADWGVTPPAGWSRYMPLGAGNITAIRRDVAHGTAWNTIDFPTPRTENFSGWSPSRPTGNVTSSFTGTAQWTRQLTFDAGTGGTWNTAGLPAGWARSSATRLTRTVNVGENWNAIAWPTAANVT